nr:polyprenyl synthetase family protein [Chloroflexia bacterium]
AAAIDELDDRAPLLQRMIGFHLGGTDSSGVPTDARTRTLIQGKRIRPALAMLSCTAAGGDAADAAPLAAAIELLHNFTLIHDDIQDRSPNRRHRATVWRVWGDAQAINAGDAMFAAAQIALLRTDTMRVDPGLLVDVLREFNRATIRIVQGQVLDLEFEGRSDVTPEQYLSMIRGKTAAIVRFAAWAGARIGGAPVAVADRLAEFGDALGVGFQVRDDLLGIWGSREETGKDQADDIRRRKQSLPILLLRDQATPPELSQIDALSGGDEIDQAGIATIVALLDAHDVRDQVSRQVDEFHRQASTALAAMAPSLQAGSASELGKLVRRLEARPN